MMQVQLQVLSHQQKVLFAGTLSLTFIFKAFTTNFPESGFLRVQVSGVVQFRCD